MKRSDASKIGGMDHQTLRDWLHRFNKEGPDGLIYRKGPERARRSSEEQMRELAELVETGPDPDTHVVVRRRLVDLQRVIEDQFGVAYNERTISGLLVAMGLSHMNARPVHLAQNAKVVDASKNFDNTLYAHTGHLPRSKRIEIWFQDEARIGQKDGQVRLLARKGTRSRLPAHQRYSNTYLFGAICPVRGTGAALMLPWADTQAMQLHLDEMCRRGEHKAHPVVLMDRAGWYTTGKLKVPNNITIILYRHGHRNGTRSKTSGNTCVPTDSQFVYSTITKAIIEAACDVWNSLVSQPAAIKSIGMSNWEHTDQL